jgi:ABC-type antimicrobial peptide transport system permease subunit
VLCLVVDRGMLLAATGALLGSAGAFAASRVLNGMLFGAASTHVAVMFGVRAGPIGAAALVSYLPARRATRVDPIGAHPVS